MSEALNRLRLAGALNGKLAEYRAGNGSALERLRLARDIRELIIKLRGGVIGAPSETADDELSDDPNSPNYRYADTGYIADSRKERAAMQITLAKASGLQVQATSIDWKAIEQNPRQAAELIIKSNLFGQVDWDGLAAAGMDPAAGFLVDRVYASIAPAPDDNPQARKDYANALVTIRSRLEKVTTVKDVRAVLDEILDELRGANLNADETAQYAALRAQIDTLRGAIRDIEEPVNVLYREANATRGDEYAAEGVIGTRKRRGWEIKPEHTQALADAQARSKAAWKRWEEALHDKNAREEPMRAQLKTLGEQANAITAAARARAEDSPVVRGWTSFGPKFLAVLKYRYTSGSDAFRSHVVNAENGKIKDWSWANKERAPVVRGATKQEVTFQLQVIDSYERVGGKPVKAESTAALKGMFGLREVQSGNWVLKDPNSAKFHVEQSAAAFSDMADVLGIDAVHLGLGGRLGMAFGARGTGGKNAARAHYEPVHRVVNLTKMGGGGALGHELFHAFDNILPAIVNNGQSKKAEYGTRTPDMMPAGPLRDAFAELRKALMEGDHRAPRTFDISDADRRMAKHNVEGYYTSRVGQAIKAAGNATDALLAVERMIPGADKRSTKQRRQWQQIAAAYYTPEGETTLTASVGKPMSSYAYQATLIDGGEEGKYWSEDVELAARAFQAYLEDKLEAQGRRNDYLSAMADNKFYVLTGDKPFPEGEERQRLNGAFDKLFAALREAKTFETASANKPLLDAIFGEEPDDDAQVSWPRSWLGFTVVDEGYVRATAAEFLPSAHALGGDVWLNLTDDAEGAFQIAATVVGTSFTSDKVRYALAVSMAPQPRADVRLYAVLHDVASELVTARESGAAPGAVLDSASERLPGLLRAAGVSVLEALGDEAEVEFDDEVAV